MKKIIPAVLALVAVTALSGCKRTGKNQLADSNGKKLKIGIIQLVEQIEDAGDGKTDGGDQSVDRKPQGSNQRHDPHDLFGVEVLGKEGKYQIHPQLGDEIHQHQRTQKGVGDAESLPEGNKQQRRQTEYGSRCQIYHIAASFCSFIIGIIHHRSSIHSIVY